MAFEYCLRIDGGGMGALNPQFISTANEIPGHRLTKNLGVVRGIVVRSRSLIGTIGASLQTIFGGQHYPLYESVRTGARGRVQFNG